LVSDLIREALSIAPGEPGLKEELLLLLIDVAG
jgi:hypothetical protein